LQLEWSFTGIFFRQSGGKFFRILQIELTVLWQALENLPKIVRKYFTRAKMNRAESLIKLSALFGFGTDRVLSRFKNFISNFADSHSEEKG